MHVDACPKFYENAMKPMVPVRRWRPKVQIEEDAAHLVYRWSPSLEAIVPYEHADDGSLEIPPFNNNEDMRRNYDVAWQAMSIIFESQEDLHADRDEFFVQIRVMDASLRDPLGPTFKWHYDFLKEWDRRNEPGFMWANRIGTEWIDGFQFIPDCPVLPDDMERLQSGEFPKPWFKRKCDAQTLYRFHQHTLHREPVCKGRRVLIKVTSAHENFPKRQRQLSNSDSSRRVV